MILNDADLPTAPRGLKAAIEALERRLIYESLQKTSWHRGKAAALLQIPRRTLQRKMIKYIRRQHVHEIRCFYRRVQQRAAQRRLR